MRRREEEHTETQHIYSSESKTNKNSFVVGFLLLFGEKTHLIITSWIEILNRPIGTYLPSDLLDPDLGMTIDCGT